MEVAGMDDWLNVEWRHAWSIDRQLNITIRVYSSSKIKFVQSKCWFWVNRSKCSRDRPGNLLDAPPLLYTVHDTQSYRSVKKFKHTRVTRHKLYHCQSGVVFENKGRSMVFIWEQKSKGLIDMLNDTQCKWSNNKEIYQNRTTPQFYKWTINRRSFKIIQLANLSSCRAIKCNWQRIKLVKRANWQSIRQLQTNWYTQNLNLSVHPLGLKNVMSKKTDFAQFLFIKNWYQKKRITNCRPMKRREREIIYNNYNNRIALVTRQLVPLTPHQ